MGGTRPEASAVRARVCAASPAPAPSEARRPHLDGLRGLAAAIVALCHFVLGFQPAFLSGDPAQGALAAATGLSKTPAILMFSPDLAVFTFFVLSGFVLASSSARPSSIGPARTLAAQILRRWIRLAGPILGSSCLIWAAVEAGWLPSPHDAALAGAGWIVPRFAWTAWQPNSLLVMARQSCFDVFGFGPHWWNAALWTMPIEFAGSLGVFAAYAVLRDAPKQLRVAVIACALAASLRTNYAAFAAGALMWECHAALVRPGRAAWAGGAAAFVAAVLLGGAPYDMEGTWYLPVYLAASSHLDQPVLAAHRLGAALMTAAALSWPPLRNLLGTPRLAALGRASFMVNLCHILVLCAVTSRVTVALAPYLGYDAATLAALIVSTPVLAFIAAVMTRAADRPFIRLSRRAAGAARSVPARRRAACVDAGAALAAAPVES